MTSPKLLRIAVFYLIALVFAYFFRYAQPEWYDTLDLPAGLTIVRNLLSALGPWLGAFLVTILLRPERKVSLFGSGRLPSLIMIAVPVVVFTLFGASNSDGLNEYYYGLIVGLLMAVYCLFEESGWRGYLQDELRGMNPFLRYVVIGVMWYAWHLTFLGSSNLVNELIILAILIGASWGIGQAVEHTKSLMVAACFHMIGNLVALSSLLKSCYTFSERMLISGICVLIWILILMSWEKLGRSRSVEA